MNYLVLYQILCIFLLDIQYTLFYKYTYWLNNPSDHTLNDLEKGFSMIAFERRKMERFSLELPTSLSVVNSGKKQETLEILTRNVCAGGAFFKTGKPLFIGTDLKINLIISLDRIKHLKGQRSRIDVSGSVIRTEDQGMAVCFGKRYRIEPC